MKVRDLLREGTEKLKLAGIENAEYDARQLLMKAYGVDASGLLMQLGRELCPGATGGKEPVMITECPGDCGAMLRFDEDIVRRATHIPLQHITGNAYFMGLKFKVTPDVLIPRQDTETLAELVLEREKETDIRVLDLCTGSGCIAVALKKLGGYAEVTASDLSERALAVARENAERNRTRVRFVQSDLFAGIDGRYDVIVSNPPYIATDVIDGLEKEVREHDPRMALDGGEDGLEFYRQILGSAGAYLVSGGRIYLEIGFDQAEAVTALLYMNGFTGVETRTDLAGRDRVVSGRLR